MKSKISGIIIITVLSLLIKDVNLSADTLPLGGRTASMGGAGSAFCRDSAAPYINPAGISLVAGNIFSLSTSLYTQTDYQIQDFFIPGGIDTSTTEMGPTYEYDQKYLTSSQFIGFPGSLSYYLHLSGSQVISFTAIVPTYERINFDGNIRINFPNADPTPVTMDMSETYIIERTEYYFGPSYGMTTGNLRFGASVFLLYRTLFNSVESTTFNTIGTSQFNNGSITGYGQGETWGLTSVVGIQYSLSALNIGVAFTTPVINLAGSFSNSGKFTLTNPDTLGVPDEIEIDRGEGDIGYHKPAKCRIGIAYEKPLSWSVALDVEYIFATSKIVSRDVTYETTLYVQGAGVTESTVDDTSSSGSAAAINIYLGGEYYLNSSWSLRAGAFYMPSPTSDLDVSSNADVLTMKIDRIGGTIGLANFTDSGETNFGISVTYGFGETVAGDFLGDFTSPSYKKVDVNLFQIALFFSGEVDFSRVLN